MIRPRICSVPPASDSIGREAVEFVAAYGVVLDEWQQFALEQSLGVRDDGKWAAFEVGVNVARQNGKNEIALARELVGLFMLDDRLVIHSAHEFKTSSEHQRRMEEIIADSPDLLKRVKTNRGSVGKHSHGEESIELRSGARIRFMTRTKGAGRGHVGDLVVLDEAMILALAMMGALMPTMSARSIVGNPQLLYFFTAVDREIHEHGLVVARLRERGLGGDDPSLAYFEWSVPANDPADVTAEMALSPELWAMANPAMDIRISREHIANEQRSMDARTFAVERLGAGAYPSTTGDETVIAIDQWDACADTKSKLLDPVAFAFDVTPSRATASIAAAGLRDDGLPHFEVVAHQRGTGWIVARLLELQAHRPVGVFCAAGSPAESLVPELEQAGVDVAVLTGKEQGMACGLLFDKVEQNAVRHLGTQELQTAIAGAMKRPLGEAWAWSRKNSTVDISPLCAVTFALYGHATAKPRILEPMVGFA